MVKITARGWFAAFAILALATPTAFAQRFSDGETVFETDSEGEDIPLAERILRDPEESEPVEVDVDGMLGKAGRGLTNIFTSWFEIPHHWATEWEEIDPFSAFFSGLVKGTAWGVVRFFSGVYDIVTFPVPFPAEYDSLIQPGLLISATWGEQTDLTRFGTNDPNYPEGGANVLEGYRF